MTAIRVAGRHKAAGCAKPRLVARWRSALIYLFLLGIAAACVVVGTGLLSNAAGADQSVGAPMPQHTFAATDPDTYVEDVKATWKPTVEGPRVVVEALEIQAPLVSTGALAGALVLPDPPAATWYEQTQPPGADKGATLIASHVDSGFGDAAPFSRLHAIKKGTPIEIRDAAGKTHKYKASSIQVYERQAVPREVFELTGKPRLVLVTCSGPTINSGSAAHYLYNLVVVATPIS